MMTINLRKIITATMATGMLLGVAGGVNASLVQHAPITANASRRVYRHYHHAYHTALMLNGREVNNMAKQDSFDMLRFVPTAAGRRALKHNAGLLNSHHIAYGVYMANIGDTRRNAKMMHHLAPRAAFYTDVQNKNIQGNISNRARNFANVLKQYKKPLVYYAGSISASQKLNDSVRELFNYQFTSRYYHAGSPVWRFAQNGMNDHIGRAIVDHTLSNTMPLEFLATARNVHPMDSVTVSALYQAAKGNLDQASRLAESAAMQQWQHNYEKHQYLGPSKNISSVKRSLNQHSMRYYQHKASKRFIRLGAANGTKSTASGQKGAYYTNNQMKSAYTSMQKYMNHGYNGTHAPEACEATSMDMGLHLMGLNRHVKLRALLSRIPVNNNPEKGYSASPLAHKSGTSLYPQALTNLAKKYGARNSSILEDNAYYTGSKRDRNYLVKTGTGHSYGKTRGRLSKYASKKKIIQELSEGHPIVIEADHDFNHPSGDHVILLWGYNNGKFYWCDPNDNPKYIPNHGGSVNWSTVFNTMNAPKRGPRAVILAR